MRMARRTTSTSTLSAATRTDCPRGRCRRFGPLIEPHADVSHSYYTSPAFIGTVVATCAASICAYLGWVLPANTLTLINEDIGPSVNINWVGTVWTLGSSIGFLLFGRLGDIFGRKELVIAVNVLGLVGCIVGGTATSVGQLIGANGCNGIAAAGQLSFQVILGELVSPRGRRTDSTQGTLADLKLPPRFLTRCAAQSSPCVSSPACHSRYSDLSLLGR